MSPFKKQKVGVTILRESQWKELDKISKNANFRKIEKWKRKSIVPINKLLDKVIFTFYKH